MTILSRAGLTCGLSVVLLAGSGAAQEIPCSLRTAFATVIDRQGNPIRGLAAKDFRGKFRGKPLEIVSATLDTAPRHIVLVLDVSASMAEEETWGAATTLAQDFYRFAPLNSSLAMVVFASTVLDIVGLGQSQAMAGKLAAYPGNRKLAPKGGRRTALYDVILRALELLDPPQLGDVIYAITDAGENASKARRSEVERQALASGVRVFSTVLFRPPAARRGLTPEDMEGPRVLRELARGTGSNMLRLIARSGPANPRFWRTAEEKKTILAMAIRMYQEMGVFYRLEIKLLQQVEKPRNWQLEVVNEKGKRRRDVSVLYPQRLTPCTAAAASQ